MWRVLLSYRIILHTSTVFVLVNYNRELKVIIVLLNEALGFLFAVRCNAIANLHNIVDKLSMEAATEIKKGEKSTEKLFSPYISVYL